jgi:hypothetical protein
MVVTIAMKGHGVCLVLDLEKLRGIDWNSLDTSKEVFIYCYDSSRVIGNLDPKGEPIPGEDLGRLTENTAMINRSQQESGSCWYHAAAAVLTAAKNPGLIDRIRSGEIKLYELYANEEKTKYKPRDGWLTPVLGPENRANEFMLSQMEMLQQLAEVAGIGRVGKELLVERVVSYSLKNALMGLASDYKLLGKFNERISALAKEKIGNAEEHRKKFLEDLADIDKKVFSSYWGEGGRFLRTLRKLRTLEEHLRGLKSLTALGKATGEMAPGKTEEVAGQGK